jgi:ABC-type transport system substrate-binding protein
MQKVKWIFFGYIAFVAMMIAAIGFALNRSPARDPDTFYAAYAGAIKTLDPAEIGDTLGDSILKYVCEGLYNYKFKVIPYELYPELASAMPIVSPDGLTMTIPIRHGIHYYDPEKTLWPDGTGPEISAADFVYSFKRVCDFHTSGTNYSFIFQDHIVGGNDWYAYTQKTPVGKVNYDLPVEGFGVDPKDPYKLILKFTSPYPQMIYNLVNCPCAPVCRQLVEHWGDQIRKHPVGTGAYCIAENLREQRITFVANPIYRGRPDIDGGTPIADADRYPKIKRVQLDYFSEDLPVWLLFRQGLFDVGGIPKDAYSQAIGAGGDLTPDMAAEGVVLRKYTDPTTEYIGFNMADPIVGKNKPLRQAMSMAFDRKSFIDKFANGRGLPAIGIIPPGFPTFDPNRINPYTQFNLTAARAKMADAIKLNGGPIPPITILFRDADTLSRQMAAFYTDLMAQIGVTLVPEFRDFARWQQMVDGRQFQIFDGGWQSDYPDEQDFLQLFYGPSAAPGGLNAIGYTNPEFDKLYDQTIVMQDTPQRRALYLKMQLILEDDCPWLITEYPLIYSLSYDWVKNRFAMDYGHGYTEYVVLDKDLRAKRLAERH